VIIPKSIEVAELIGLQIERIVAVVKRQASDFYKQHLAEHLDPYVAKIDEALAPIVAIYKDKIYTLTLPLPSPLSSPRPLRRPELLGAHCRQASFPYHVARRHPWLGLLRR
jgi:hypothetical protein